MQVVLIAASCCVGHVCMVGGGGGCSCMLLLHPVPTSADTGCDFASCVLTFAPYILTLGPGAWGVSLLSTCANIPLAQGGGCHQLQLALAVLFHSPLAQIVHLHTWWFV